MGEVYDISALHESARCARMRERERKAPRDNRHRVERTCASCAHVRYDEFWSTVCTKHSNGRILSDDDRLAHPLQFWWKTRNTVKESEVCDAWEQSSE